MAITEAERLQRQQNLAAFKALPQAAKISQIQGVTGYTPPAMNTQKNPVGSPLSAGQAAGSGNGVYTASNKGFVPPAYGSNVVGFDANNAAHKSLADAGQSWATAKASGDTAGMSAAAALGQQIRSGVQGASYDSVKGVSALPTMTQEVKAQALPSGGYMPQDAVTNVRSSSELQSTAGDQNAIERAALLTAINERMGSIRNSANYSNQLLKDQRVLEDLQTNRTLNPFSGKTSYDKAMIGRGRGIDDSARATQLDTQLNAVQEELFNFDKLAPERQRQIYNDLLEMERNFGLNQGQLTGTYAGGQTLAAKTADQNYQLGLSGLSGQLPSSAGGGQTLQAQQFDYSKQADQRDFDFKQSQQEWENAFAQGQFDFSKAQTIWERAFQGRKFEQDMKEAAASRGLQWASLGQRDKEFVADQAFREKQFSYQQDQDILKNRNQPGANLSAKTSTDNYNLIYDDIDDPTTTKEEARKLLSDNSVNLTDTDYKKLNDIINDKF